MQSIKKQKNIFLSVLMALGAFSSIVSAAQDVVANDDQPVSSTIEQKKDSETPNVSTYNPNNSSNKYGLKDLLIGTAGTLSLASLPYLICNYFATAWSFARLMTEKKYPEMQESKMKAQIGLMGIEAAFGGFAKKLEVSLATREGNKALVEQKLAEKSEFVSSMNKKITQMKDRIEEFPKKVSDHNAEVNASLKRFFFYLFATGVAAAITGYSIGYFWKKWSTTTATNKNAAEEEQKIGNETEEVACSSDLQNCMQDA
jgi:hypothetical protein